MAIDWTLGLGLVVTATLVAGAALLAISALSLRAPTRLSSVFGTETPATVLIFDGDRLLDATPPAHALIDGTIDSGVEIGGPRLRALSRLEPIFPGLAARLEGLPSEGRFVLCSREDLSPPLILRAEWLGGLTRLTLIDSDSEQILGGPDGAAEVAARDELCALRQTLAEAPMPIWRENAEGEVIWANSPYLRLALERLEPGQDLTWPLPDVFGQIAGETAPLRRRVGTHWYEVTGIASAPGLIFYAQPADPLVRAETSLHDFMQTLTKTFAQLPIGLAIFDGRRVLQMFNPALIDLSGLGTEFLISRPTLPMLLDAMRERNMLPEQRDYRSWRRQIVEMEEAAASGLYEDTWTLPSGQTWRVSGRPHPNGALAFMIEDISTEMTRTRRYRADLELGQAVIDAISDAVVVFAQDGAVAMSNLAATRLWGPEGASGLMPARGESQVIGHWRRMTAPTLLWGDLSAYIGSFGPREPWEGEARMTDGRALECRVSPMPHGSTLVSFRLSGGRNPSPMAEDRTGDGPGKAASDGKGGPDKAVMRL
ncbi:PAS-domain containing protein [Pseudogemmobacter sonorensis]|uniref:PAS-domain containing protein n=1 Tax=Pseudogemmobacter sonorensis TaxID=2989681 RepID=UPI00368282A1